MAHHKLLSSWCKINTISFLNNRWCGENMSPVRLGYLCSWLGLALRPIRNAAVGDQGDLIYSDLYAGHSFSVVTVHNSSISLPKLESIMLSFFCVLFFLLWLRFVCRAIKQQLWQMAAVIFYWQLMTKVVSSLISFDLLMLVFLFLLSIIQQSFCSDWTLGWRVEDAQNGCSQGLMELLINTSDFRVILKAVFSFSGKQPFCSYWFCSAFAVRPVWTWHICKVVVSVAECVQPGSLRFGKKKKTVLF